MNDLIEIRWHGRGGQGAKTVALLFADTVLSTGKYVQAFPEYGPERTGAPVQSFNRISTEPITLHCHVTTPDYVIILDETLIKSIPVTQGLNPTGCMLVNTTLSPLEIRDQVNYIWKEHPFTGGKIFTVDASNIARETIGKNIPNTPMLGALVKVMDTLDIDHVIGDVRHKLEQKFRHKPEIIEGNIHSIQRAYNEVITG